MHPYVSPARMGIWHDKSAPNAVKKTQDDEEQLWQAAAQDGAGSMWINDQPKHTNRQQIDL